MLCMGKKAKNVQLNIAISPELKAAWKDFCEQRGLVQQLAGTAAVIAFMTMSTEDRERAMQQAWAGEMPTARIRLAASSSEGGKPRRGKYADFDKTKTRAQREGVDIEEDEGDEEQTKGAG